MRGGWVSRALSAVHELTARACAWMGAARGVCSLLETLSARRLRGPGSLTATGEPVIFGQCLNKGVDPAVLEQIEESLRTAFPPALRELFRQADGQRKGTPGVLVVPKNRTVEFLSVKQAKDLVLHWREQAEHPIHQKWWKRSRYDPAWLPVGYARKAGVALCISTRVGRVLRFTTPDADISHTSQPVQHLAESLEDYLSDLDDHFRGARQPFVIAKSAANPAAGL
mmetsp:Transcript_134929/g.248069  ORF Transcript_134929/g.248069 Transcript_134929/m.248069 type:complete len:226 (+) Transcript_134929:1-678(+)